MVGIHAKDVATDSMSHSMTFNTWPELLDLTFDESRANLRSLELEAYAGVVSALRAQGELSSSKKSILSELQSAFG